MHTCDRAHVCRLVHTCVTVPMAVCAAVTSAEKHVCLKAPGLTETPTKRPPRSPGRGRAFPPPHPQRAPKLPHLVQGPGGGPSGEGSRGGPWRAHVTVLSILCPHLHPVTSIPWPPAAWHRNHGRGHEGRGPLGLYFSSVWTQGSLGRRWAQLKPRGLGNTPQGAPDPSPAGRGCGSGLRLASGLSCHGDLSLILKEASAVPGRIT